MLQCGLIREFSPFWSIKMAIIQTVQFNDFQDAFRACDRMDNFTRQGMKILFDYIEETSNDTGKNIELDVTALCCDYSEANAGDIISDYNLEFDDNMDEEELNNIARSYLEENTSIIGETATGFVYTNF